MLHQALLGLMVINLMANPLQLYQLLEYFELAFQALQNLHYNGKLITLLTRSVSTDGGSTCDGTSALCCIRRLLNVSAGRLLIGCFIITSYWDTVSWRPIGCKSTPCRSVHVNVIIGVEVVAMHSG